jgi:16S rRNA (uracil1498-N3)-methyltransferase
MRAIRIHVPGPLQAQQAMVLSASHSHRLLHVLRLKVGTKVWLFDGEQPLDFPATIVLIKAKKVHVELAQPKANDGESPLSLHLMPALLRPDKMDWVVQKAVELGAHSIRPVLTQYSQKRGKQAASNSRMQHWQQIIIHACEQCGRSQLPVLFPVISFADIKLHIREDAQCWYAHPLASSACFAQQPLPSSIHLLVGPEGGFGPQELEQLLAWQAKAMYLGPRVLRAETAAVSAMTLCQYLCGDLK